jgi:hypothetical protein
MPRPTGEEGDGSSEQHGAPSGPSMTRETWNSEEAHVVSIAQRALGRARHRPGWILGIAGLAAAAFVGSRLYRAPTYEAELHFHLAEGDVTDPTHAPRPPRAVREYVFNVALSRDRVEQIMKKYDWSPRYLARDRIAAVDEFREDVSVDVSRNYFVYDRRPSDPPRSAVVTVSLVGTDPEQTAATLHEIGESIVLEQRGQRTERLAHARELLETQLTQARARARYLQDAIGMLTMSPGGGGTREAIDRRTRAAALQVEQEGALRQLAVLERRATDVAFTEAAEGEDLGLRLELIDESLVALTPRLTPLQLARRALMVFVVVALLAVPAVGAFDDRIYTPADLAARALPHFGSLVRFPGDDAGSFRARAQARTG